MKLSIQNPRDFLNPLYSKKTVGIAEFDQFKLSLEKYKRDIAHQHSSKQSEPNIVSNSLKPFIESLGYNTNSWSQNGQSGIDLAVMLDSNPAVIIEAKTHNSKDMLTESNLNTKALHEAILYFMRERDKGNAAIYHIVITDFYNWYIFDAKEFERLFWKRPVFKKIFHTYMDKTQLINTTGEVFKALENAIDEIKSEDDLFNDEHIECTKFHLEHRHSDRELAALYKLLSPDSLCKKFNPNDANSLNKEFYSELLYILGLEEVKQNGKKIIGPARSAQAGSLYENTAHKLMHTGKPHDFESVIGLLIIWINRILFLKLLESQITKWTNQPNHKFLNGARLGGYGNLDKLFFDVLAKPIKERPSSEFSYIPYLNSSLFECHPDETALLTIATLSDDARIDYFGRTVVRNDQAKPKTGQVNTLTYLFEFLDAYDFGSNSTEEISSSENKSLINASVLGLIFEKINGYKDGSFYTPSFITMYMAREALRKTVLDKFNAIDVELQFKNWQELKRYCDKNGHKDNFIARADNLVNSITICDPAVGSGHFLVSVLNEIILIKHELGLFNHKGMRIELINDELLIVLDGEWFEYKRPNDFKSANHLTQKMIFEEKQRIIENQLFGVDINPNSAQITKLRLWIELLKHSYYDEGHQLVTLPNIDINIKTGNSLISRFELAENIKDKNLKLEIEAYKLAVKNYKENIGKKQDVMASINAIKSKFGDTLKVSSKASKNLDVKLAEWVNIFGFKELNDDLKLRALKVKPIDDFFGNDAAIAADRKPLQKKMLEELKLYQQEFKEFEGGKIYEGAFEWRFEFPEVLDDDGAFVGFDIVIGNPPYFNIDTFGAGSPMLRYIPEHYASVYMDKSDILFYFIAKSSELSKGQTAFIVSNAMLYSDKARKLRNHILETNPISKIVNFEKLQVFDEASITAMMIFFDKSHSGDATVLNFPESTYDRNQLIAQIDSADNAFLVSLKKDGVFSLDKQDVASIHAKIDGNHPKLGSLLKVGKGMETAANDVFTFDHNPFGGGGGG